MTKINPMTEEELISKLEKIKKNIKDEPKYDELLLKSSLKYNKEHICDEVENREDINEIIDEILKYNREHLFDKEEEKQGKSR